MTSRGADSSDEPTLRLDRDEADRLLGLLRERLEARGIDAHLHVVGGVAVARLVASARVTSDIDAAISTTDRSGFDAAVQEIADAEGLPPDWINARATPWMLRSPAAAVGAGVVVTTAELAELLAMKLAAQRDKRDETDIVLLVRLAGIVDADVLERIPHEAYGDDDVAFDRVARDDLRDFVADVLAAAWPTVESPPSEQTGSSPSA